MPALWAEKTLNDTYSKVSILNHWLPLNLANLASSRCRQSLLTHNTLTHGSHLWAALGVDDGGDDVTTKGGTNLVEEAVVLLAALSILMLADDKLCAVGSKAAVER